MEKGSFAVLKVGREGYFKIFKFMKKLKNDKVYKIRDLYTNKDGDISGIYLEGIYNGIIVGKGEHYYDIHLFKEVNATFADKVLDKIAKEVDKELNM